MRDDTKRVQVTIDGVSVAVSPGTTVVDAAQRIGIEIPIFCHHPRLEPVGMCRMCLVDVGTPAVDRATGQAELDETGQPIVRFFPKLQAGCTMRVSDGMVVRTNTDEVSEARRSVLEFLLTSHPLDCPVCDKGGECPLQNLTMRYGPGQSRFVWGEKFRFPKPVPIGPLIALDRERCVLCARCIRFSDELADDPVLGFQNRSRGMEIVSTSDPPFDSYFSGNTTDICPVGALTTKDFRFEARVWELVPRPGVCGHCPVGCSLVYDTRQGAIERVMPRENEAVNEIWLCDKGRFAHHYAAARNRFSAPLVRRNGELTPVSWDDALSEITRRLRDITGTHGPGAVGGIAGGSRTNEDFYAFGRFLRGIVGTPHVDHLPATVRDDLPLRAGAAVDPTLLGRGTTIIVAGVDVEEEAPVLFLNLFKALRAGARIVVLSGRPQKLDPHVIGLRYAYGGHEWSLGAALALTVLNGRAQLSDDAAAFVSALGRSIGDGVRGEHPVHESDLAVAAEAIANADDVVVIYGREATELGLDRPLAALLAATGHLTRSTSGLLAVGAEANSQGAADMGLLPNWLPGYGAVDDPTVGAALVEAGWPQAPPTDVGLDARAMLAGGVRALFLLGTDPLAEDASHADALASMDLVVAFAMFPNATTAVADIVLPSRSLPEVDGTLTNFTRRVQRTYAAVDPVGQAREDWRTLRDLGQRLGVAEAYATAADVTDEIARALSTHRGLTSAALGPAAASAPTDVFLPFAPQTEARYVSYEGTSYANVIGDGLQWPLLDGGVDADSGETHDQQRVAGLRALLAWRPPEEPVRTADVASTIDEGAGGPADGGRRLTLVVTRKLYDSGPLLTATAMMRPLVHPPTFEISAFDAAAAGLGDGARAVVVGLRGRLRGVIRVREHVTPGTILAAEHMAWEPPLRMLTGGGPTATIELYRDADTEADSVGAGDSDVATSTMVSTVLER